MPQDIHYGLRVEPQPGLIDVHSMGLATDHEVGYVADYPNGQPNLGVLIFHTPFLALTKHGKERGESGNVMLVSAGFPQWHTGIQGRSFINDWLFINGESLEPLLTELRLPLNVILRVSSPARLSRLSTDIFQEIVGRHTEWKRMVDLQVRRILTLIARGISRQAGPESGALGVHRDTLAKVRFSMLKDFQQQWTVKELAKQASLSSSRFAVLYKACFGVSPMEDLISTRLEYAEVLLKNQKMNVSDVAQHCGFNSVFYFSRCFSKRYGCPPSSFR